MFLKHQNHPYLTYIIFVISLTTVGCTWRNADTEYFLGPMLFRATQPPYGKAYLWEEQSVFPFTIEGGEHNGLTVGFFNQVAAAPSEYDSDWHLTWCSGLFSFSCSAPTAADGWHWSGFYSRVEHRRPAEFYDRAILGTSIGIGMDRQYLTIGYSADTRLKPRDNAYYIFCYRRKTPLFTRFEIAKDTTVFSTFIKQEVCR